MQAFTLMLLKTNERLRALDQKFKDQNKDILKIGDAISEHK